MTFTWTSPASAWCLPQFGSDHDNFCRNGRRNAAEPSATGPASDKTRLRRSAWLAKYDRDAFDAISDAGIICQVGYVTDGVARVIRTNH